MLRVLFKPLEELHKIPDFIGYPDAIFDMEVRDRLVEERWLQDPVIRACIEDVDQIKLGPDTRVSIHEIMPLQGLATGTKNIVLCKYLNQINRLSHMGVNCYPYLFEIADSKEVRLGASYSFVFPKQLLAGRKIMIANTGTVYADYDSYFWAMHEVMRKEGMLE